MNVGSDGCFRKLRYPISRPILWKFCIVVKR